MEEDIELAGVGVFKHSYKAHLEKTKIDGPNGLTPTRLIYTPPA